MERRPRRDRGRATERLDAVAADVVRELGIFERLMADSGPGSWREGAKAISLALVDLTERIHSAISLRLQQTQAIAALLRRAWIWPRAVQAPRCAHANISGTPPARCTRRSGCSSRPPATPRCAWIVGSPIAAARPCRWWTTSLAKVAAPPPPPRAAPAALRAGDRPTTGYPGEDPRIRELEEARARLIERLISAGSAGPPSCTLESFDELRLLASFLWLPRDSSAAAPPRPAHPVAGRRDGAPRAILRGPGFEVSWTTIVSSRPLPRAQAHAQRGPPEPPRA